MRSQAYTLSTRRATPPPEPPSPAGSAAPSFHQQGDPRQIIGDAELPARGSSGLPLQPGCGGPWGRRLEPVETLAAPPPIATPAWSDPAAKEPCARCGSFHRGLCARIEVGALASALRSLGVPRGWADAEAGTVWRQRSCTIVRGIVTRSGRDRELAIATCGRFAVAEVDGVMQLRPLYCRDRLCGACQVRRARRLAGELRELLSLRVASLGDVHWFATLTQPKPIDTDPREAVKRIRAAWRQLTNKKTALGREFHRRFAGGIKSIEVTWSAAGQLRKDGTRVPYSGWHAHVHLLLENRSTWDHASLQWLTRAWCSIVGGRPGAQHYAPMNADRIGQLAKYVTKPLDDSIDLDLAGELARVLHSARLHEGFGALRAWRKLLPEDPVKHVVAWAHLADVFDTATSGKVPTLSVIELVKLAADPERGRAAVVFSDAKGGTVSVHDAASVFDAVRRWVRSSCRTSAARDHRAARPPP